MTTEQFIRALRRAWWMPVLGFALLAASGYTLSKLSTPAYAAHTQVYVYQRIGDTAADLYQGSNFTQSQMASYAALATSPTVLGPVIDQLRLPTTAEDLSNRIAVANPQDTTILTIEVGDTSATAAADIANQIASQFTTTISEIAPKAADTRAAVAVRTIAPATPPSNPSSPRTLMNTGLGAIAGLLLGFLAAYLYAHVDTRVRNRDAIASLTSLPLLTSIPKASTQLVLIAEPNSARAEVYRQLRADLQFSRLEERGAAFVITSSVPAEGKTTVSCNLALAWAETEARVLLVDADLHRPSVAETLGMEGEVGLTTVLLRRIEPKEAIRTWANTALDVLPSGSLPPNPSELLTSQRMADLITQLRDEYDVLIIDSSPSMVIAGPAVMAHQCTGAVVVADMTKIRRPQLTRTLEALNSAGTRTIGIIPNRAKLPPAAHSYYGAPAKRSRHNSTF